MSKAIRAIFRAAHVKMPGMEKPLNWLQMLEELRSMAQLGLHYATGDAYDQKRYARLLELSAQIYADAGHLPPATVLERFRSELGHITPKVGVDGAIFDAQDRLLLVLRKDDKCWGLPAGWCDMNESPRQALERELREELDLTIRAGRILDIFTRLPGDYGTPHTSYHVLIEAELLGGTPRCQPEEVLDWGWFGPDDQLQWHLDHQRFARFAWANKSADSGGAAA